MSRAAYDASMALFKITNAGRQETDDAGVSLQQFMDDPHYFVGCVAMGGCRNHEAFSDACYDLVQQLAIALAARKQAETHEKQAANDDAVPVLKDRLELLLNNVQFTGDPEVFVDALCVAMCGRIDGLGIGQPQPAAAPQSATR